MKDKIQGKAEELKGRVTGDRTEEAKGKARKQLGKAKDKVRDVRERVFEDRPGPEHRDRD